MLDLALHTASQKLSQQLLQMIVVIEYGINNVRSIVNKIERLKFVATVGRTESDLRQATKIILPGIGHFAAGMENLRSRGLLNVLNQKVLEERVPVLGICLGMQFLAEWSEEGNAEGLGWIKATVKRFNFPPDTAPRRVPHINWNSVSIKQNSPLLTGVPTDNRFYFVHSYHMECKEQANVVGSTTYGYEFTSIVQKDNIYGTQFHPEKSHGFGLTLIKNFLTAC